MWKCYPAAPRQSGRVLKPKFCCHKAAQFSTFNL